MHRRLKAGTCGMVDLSPNKKIIIRCDFGTEIGYGHVVRCVAVADELKETGCEVVFATIGRQEQTAFLNKYGYDAFVSNSHTLTSAQERDWLCDIKAKFAFDVLLCDVRTELQATDLRDIKDQGIAIVLIDDASSRRLVADLCFFPPVPQVAKLDWRNFTGELKCGPEWVIFRDQFSDEKYADKSRKREGEELTILISMGGSDPLNLSSTILAALEKIDESFNVDIIIGPGFQYQKELAFQIKNATKHVTLWKEIDNIAEIMLQADLAIASFGMTAYELALFGVPSVLFSLTEDHEQSASFLVDAEVAISIGTDKNYLEDRLTSTITSLMNDSDQRLKMAEYARSLFDPNGARRIASEINSLF